MSHSPHSSGLARNAITAVSMLWRDGRPVVRLLDQRELPIQEILCEIGPNLWLVDLGEIPSYPITSGEEGCWEEVALSAA